MTRAPLVALAAAAVLLAAGPGPALADVTPEQVWQDLRDAAREAGLDLSAQENRRDGALVLVRPRLDLGSGTVALLPDITLRQTAERAVSLELPARFPLTLDLPPGPAGPEEITFTVSAPGLSLILRDISAAKADFELTAPSLSASLDPVRMPLRGGQPWPGDVFAAFALADLTLGHSHLLGSADLTSQTRFSLGTLHLEFRADVPDDGVKADALLDLAALAGHLVIDVPPEAGRAIEASGPAEEPDFATLVEILDAGAKFDLALTHGAASASLEATEPATGPTAFSLSAASGSTLASLDRTALVYDVASGATRLYYRGNQPDIPVPEFEVSLDEYRTMARLGLPGGGTWGSAAGQANSGASGQKGPPGQGEWALAYRIAGLSFSPVLWDLADPGRVIPRDPMSLVAEMSGIYVLDPAALRHDWQSTPQSPPPFEEITLNLAELLVSGAGASLSGSGEVTLDLGVMETVDDMPQATGSLAFVTMGANGLLDRMASLGLLSQDELMSARMGLMFIGKIEGGADRLVTLLEFSGKSFSLNGQRIR